MTELNHQKSVRSGHRGIVTKKVAELETVLGITPPDTHALEQLRAALEEKRDLLTDLDKRIVSLLNDETEIIAEIEGAEGVKDVLRSALFKIDRAVGASSAPSPGIAPTTAAIAVKLPELTLMPFDGDPTKWKTFWETYLSDINK